MRRFLSHISLFLFLISFLLSFVLRFHNLSPFLVYPDSYQNLLVAQNIRQFHSVLGVLGNNGYVFPPYFMWSRPIFPLLINLGILIIHNAIFSARVISFLAGILSLPMAFLFLRSVYNYCYSELDSGSPARKQEIPGQARNDKNKVIALVGTFLLAISFYHTVWGGFVMTETLGVFFMLLFLISLFSIFTVRAKRELSFKNFSTSSKNILLNFLPGVLFSIAVFTRYEYAILIFPVLFIILAYRHSENTTVIPAPFGLELRVERKAGIQGSRDKPGMTKKIQGMTGNKNLHNSKLLRIFTFLISFFLTSYLFIISLFPINSLFSVITSQLKDFIILAGVVGIGFIALLFNKLVIPGPSVLSSGSKDLPRNLLGFNKEILNQVQNDKILTFVLFPLLFALLTLFGLDTVPFLRSFFIHEPLIAICSVNGFVYLLNGKILNQVQDDKARTLGIFSLISCVLLIFIYNKINPQMDRYMTHLLPFLLIPASLGFYKSVACTFSVILVSRSKVKTHPGSLAGVTKRFWNQHFVLPQNDKLIKIFFGVCFLLLIVYQGFLSFQGLRYLHDISWFQKSYEQDSSEELKPIINKSCRAELDSASSKIVWKIPDQVRDDIKCNIMVLVARPEPYYFFLQIPTQSIADQYPYVYFNAPESQTIIIVQDAGMQDIFPQFSKFLTKNLQSKYILAKYLVMENYHTSNISRKESAPVVVYKIQFGELIKIIKTK